MALAAWSSNPVTADASRSVSIVVDGAWRFTAVTERLIRIEYDAAQRFVDEPTEAFLRSEPKGTWLGCVCNDGDWSVLNTTAVILSYQRNAPPGVGTVIVASRVESSHRWTWGDDPAIGNLRGTARTMDNNAEALDLNCHNKVSPTMENSEMHCTWGLVSRRGWAVVNDTGAPILKDGWYAKSRNSIDVSVFLHGLDFAGALQDFFHAAGPPALPPRYALGTLFTRWFNFDSDSVMSLVDEFESRSMPLDAWIFDMNWHTYGPWGSFTWNRNSYPQRGAAMLSSLQARGLRVGANMHEHGGITTQEDTYLEVCDALGRMPGADIPFDLYNETYAMAQEDIAVRALDTKDGKQGIDFYWIDYQQGEVDSFQQTRIPKLNPTIALNRLRSMGPQRHGEKTRSMILSRWGGLGNHRYPVGFSGDQRHDWKGLAFLPYFTSTAANVAFNYWSHDTVGGDSENASDYELSVRWAQATAWSPVLRFHDKGLATGPCAARGACARVLPWDLPNAFFKAIRSAAQSRDELVPYIYTAAWACAASGLALVRPMYYEDPSDDSLYGLDQQYLFGGDMVISPITSPSGPEAKGFEEALGAVRWSVFAPTSARGWVDRLNGCLHAGGNATGTYGIHDVPGLVRQGSVIPMRPRTRGESSFARAAQPLAALEFRIMPAEAFYSGGSTNGSGSVVDDDGVTIEYARGMQTAATCEYAFHGRQFAIKLSQSGDYKGRPSRVTVRISFPQLPPIMVVSSSSLGGPSSEYSHDILGTVLTFEDVDLTANPSLQLAIDEAYPALHLPKFIGVLGRIRRARYIKDALDVANIPYGEGRTDLTSYVLAAARMTPDSAAVLPELWASAVAEVRDVLATDENLKNDDRRSKFISAMLEDEIVPDVRIVQSLVV